MNMIEITEVGVIDEQLATEILKDSLGPEGLDNVLWYLNWVYGWEWATLDGEFTAEQLKAIAWWMENKKELEDNE